MKALRLHAELITPRTEERAGRVRAARASSIFKNSLLTLEEMPVPQPGPQEILLRVSYSGLAGDDFSLAESRAESALSYTGAAALPVTLGHEFSGIVAGYGSLVSEAFREAFPVGTAVTAEDRIACGACEACRAGMAEGCAHVEELGFTSDGAHAEYVTVPAAACWSLAGLTETAGLEKALRLGALTGLYAVAYRALFGDSGRAWRPGDRVLVIGAGPLGLAATDLARAAGAGDVQVLEIDHNRRHVARELGASAALAPEDAPTLPGHYDWVLDAAGAPELLASLLEEKVAPGATLALLARTDRSVSLDSDLLRRRHARLVGSAGIGGDAFARVIRLLAAGRLQPQALVRETVSLEQALQRLLLQRKSEGKILVQHGHA